MKKIGLYLGNNDLHTYTELIIFSFSRSRLMYTTTTGRISPEKSGYTYAYT